MRENSRHRVKTLLVRYLHEVEWLRTYPGRAFVERHPGWSAPARYPGTCSDCTLPVRVGEPIVLGRVGDEEGEYLHEACAEGPWELLRRVTAGKTDADVVLRAQVLRGRQRCARCGDWLEAESTAWLVSTLEGYFSGHRAEWVGACCVVWGVTTQTSTT